MQRMSTVTCGPRSISSVSGTAVAKAVRTAVSCRPSSPRRMPSVLACTPTRCSAEMAFGDEYSTRPEPSSRITPSPTRGASSLGPSSLANGNSPEAIMRAKRLKTSM